MTASLHEQVPEALRLADEWRRETQREVDRRNSAYDHYGMGSTPETLDPLGAKMAAELRRQHAENEALRDGYNAARLEIESLKTQIIPGVQWQCGPLASGFTAPHPAAMTLADSQPAPGVDSPLARRFGGCPSCGRSDCVAMSCTRADPADLLHIAARAPADSVTAPAGGGVADWRFVPLHPTEAMVRAGDDESGASACYSAMLDAAPTPPAQATPSVLEDAARHFFDAGWKACANFCDRDDVRFDGIVGHRGCPQFEEAFRAARKQGGV